MTVVNLEDYRNGKKPAPAKDAGVKIEPHYFCMRCDTDLFKMFSNGTVNCAHCGALMRNITVKEEA